MNRQSRNDHAVPLQNGYRQQFQRAAQVIDEDANSVQLFDHPRHLDGSVGRVANQRPSSKRGLTATWKSAPAASGEARLDARIREDVANGLIDTRGRDWSGVSVSVSRGTVTLLGTVSQGAMRWEVEQLARGINGVVDIANQVRVNAHEPWRSENRWIEQASSNPSTRDVWNEGNDASFVNHGSVPSRI